MSLRNFATKVFFSAAVIVAAISILDTRPADAVELDGTCADGNRKLCGKALVGSTELYYYWV